MKTLIVAFGLFLILEGIGPALFSNAWRNMIRELSQQSDSSLKKMGSFMILVGAAIVLFFLH
ncbi:MAG: DUF2065 domain-containing protein [Vibrio sp.]